MMESALLATRYCVQRILNLAIFSSFILSCFILYWPTFALADGEFITTPPPQTGAYLAEFVEDRGYVSVINFSGNYDKKLPDGNSNSEARAVVSKEFYRTHADEYDFLVVFTAFEFETGEAVAFYQGIQNDIAGIGAPIFDNSEFFGSDGKLQGYIDMAALSRYETDPLLPEFEFLMSILSHEILHRWAARVNFMEVDGSLSRELIGKGDAHWSFLLDNGGSVEYGADWRDNGDGTFTATTVRKFFSPLDLYLMGLYRADEVPPLTLIENPDIDKNQLPQENITITGTARQITIDDIIAAEGERIPAAGSAQTEFRVGFILLKGATQTIPDHYYVALDRIRQTYAQRFAIATGGRALMHVYPRAVYTHSVGSPQEVANDGDGDGQNTSSLDQGLAWLRAQQTADGYWEDKESTRLRDTIYSLDTLLKFDSAFGNGALATAWIKDYPSVNTDFLARQLTMFGNNLESDALAKLLKYQNSDGGWGLTQGYNSDPLDAALALLALQKVSASRALIDGAIQYLLDHQNGDGGWGNAVGAKSRTAITTVVLEALRVTGSVATVVDSALAFLRLRQNSDGGFGDSSSTIEDTAMAVQVFLSFEQVDLINSQTATAYLLGQQRDDGSWNNSTYTTALAISVLKRFRFANWRVESEPVFQPDNPRDGDRVRLVTTVTNDSNLFTPETSLIIYDGNPLDAGAPVGEAIVIPVLAPGASVTVTQYWDSFDQAGEHQLYVVVDPDGLATELSESDNQTDVRFTVEVAPEGIDLSVVETDIAVMPVQPNRLPTAMGITANIRNSGKTDALQVRVLLHKNASDIVSEQLVNVSGRSSVAVNFSDELDQPGETVYTVQIDPDNEIAEVSEDNNSAQASITTAASVDFEIASSDIISDINPAIFSETINFKVAIHNRGTQATPTAEVRYLVSNGIETRDLLINNLQLAAGETNEQTIAWQVDLDGTLQFTAEVDFASLVAELDEGNNRATLSLPVETRTGANLLVNHQELVFNPLIADESGSVTLSAAILNNGNLAAGPFDVAFYLGDPDSGGIQIGEVQQVDSLLAGSRVQVMTDWNPVPSAGDKLIFVVADINDAVAEAKDEDNRAFNVLSVSSLPDLAISNGDITIEPKFPGAGSEISLTATIVNIGEQSASDVQVRVFDGEPDNGGRLVGEQVIPVLGSGGAAALTFKFNLGSGLSGRSFTVQVDPLNEILERYRANNSARKEVTVQRGDLYASNLYLSPNADGVQDSTEIFFLLQQPTDVVLQVIDAGERVVREFNEGLSSLNEGSVVWDGLDGKGRLVSDGNYQVRLIKADGEHLSEIQLHVDTNRSSLLLANNSEFEYINNLTCALDTVYAVNVLESEEQLVIEAGANDIVALDSGDARTIVSSDWFDDTYPYSTQASKDGSVIAFTRYKSGYSGLWASDGDGDNLRELHPEVEDGWALRDDGLKIYIGEEDDSVYSIDVQTGERQHLYEGESADNRERFVFKPQPGGGSKLLFLDTQHEDSGPAVLLLDADDLTFEPKLLHDSWRDGEDASRFQWSPDGSKILVTSARDGIIYLFDSRGNLLAEIDSPAGPDDYWDGPPGEIFSSDIVWSSDSAEAAFIVRMEWDSGETALLGNRLELPGIYVINMDDYNLRKLADFALDDIEGELASYHVATWDGNDWVERGVLHYRRFYREQQLDLSAYLPDVDGGYKVRIRQTGKEAAHVESVALLSAQRRAIPNRAIKREDSLMANLLDIAATTPLADWLATVTSTPRGEDVLESVSHNDYEVLDLFEAEMQVEWIGVANESEAILVLNAREEALSKLDTLPFTYAGDNERGYSHVLKTNAFIKVDGKPDANASTPLFKQFSRPGTGHPAATVIGHVGSDSEFLYGALDFTVDNTIDGDLDWASMRVKTEQGWQEFRVTANDHRYGQVGFTQTPAVSYAHKYYEFRIPLNVLGRKPGDTVIVSFQGYGTAAIVVGQNNNALPLDGQLLWPPGGRTLFYDAYGEGKWTIDLNNSNYISEVFADWPGSSSDIIDPFFTDSGRKLLFHSDRDVNDPTSVCYDKGTDLWSYESLLNLIADLRATRSNSAGGIILSGTVSDLNFERYTLEYANRDEPDHWVPIFNGSAVQIVDGRFTTWAPPVEGNYFVRLTAYDRAGNSRSVIRRTSWGEGSVITDVSLSPEFISPNGDGVQDEARLHYRVLEPVNLDFSIYNEQGDVVRTFNRNHPIIGTEHDLTWDGRDNLGLPVVDGRYRITVLGYEFRVDVDSTPPDITSLELKDAARQFQEELQGGLKEVRVIARPELLWSIIETNQYAIEIEVGDGVSPDQWRPFAQPVVRDTEPETAGIDESKIVLSLQQFAGHAFRMRATDMAGNVTTLTVPPGSQELILLGSIKLEKDNLLADRYTVAETLATPIAQLFVEYRETGSGDWREFPLDMAIVSDSGFTFDWLPPGADFGKRFDVRIKAIDASAQIFYSNEKQLVIQGSVFEWSNIFTTAITQSATASGFDATGRLTLSVPASTDGQRQVIVESVRVELSSSDDPRYVVPFELFHDEEFELPVGVSKSITYQASNLLGCHQYSTSAHIKYRVVETVGEIQSVGYGSGFINSSIFVNGSYIERPVEVPCVSLNASAVYAPTQACDLQADNPEIELMPDSGNDDIGLKLLTLYTRNTDGTQNIRYNVNKPVSGQTYRYTIDWSNNTESVRDYYAEIIDDANQSYTEKIPVLIDKTAPAVAIRYPLAGQLVCAIPRQNTDSTFSNVVDIVVGIDDPVIGQGNDPLQPFDDTLEVEMQLQASGSLSKDPLGLQKYPPNPGRPARLVYKTTHSVEGKLAELVNKNGEYRLFVQATDHVGNQQCLEQTFTIDGAVENHAPHTDNVLFSPNDDGVLDNFEFTVSVDEAVNLDISIYPAEIDERGKVTIGDDETRRLADQLQLLPSVETLSWDGRDNGDQVVADGHYMLVFDYRDACGNRNQQQLMATVDYTAPVISIDYPRAGDPIDAILEVLVTVDDEHLHHYLLELGNGDNPDPDTWVPLASGTRSLANEAAAVWNTSELTGPYTLRLTATDSVGNSSETTRYVQLSERTGLLDYFELLPSLISPNRDNRREAVNIRLGLKAASSVAVDIVDANGVVVRHLIDEQAFADGPVNLSWDGTDDAGNTVADGVYQVSLVVALADNPAVKQAATLTLTVDASAPQIALTRPSSFTNGLDNVVGTISDQHLLNYEVFLTSTPQTPQWDSLASGNRNQTQGILASLGGLAEGHYALRILAADEGESASEKIQPFTVDNTPPVIDILTPELDTLISSGTPNAAISIDIVDDNFASYTIEIGTGNTPNTWEELSSGSEWPAANPVVTPDLSAYDDGSYTLRLVVVDAADNKASKTRLIGIDNTAPMAEILSPADGGYVTGPIAITGTAADPNFLSYRLEVAPGVPETASQWTLITERDNGVSNATLLDWRSLPPDGKYVLRLEVRDKAQNRVSSDKAIIVDTTPPSMPQGLDATVESTEVRLTWQANEEEDIAGYRIYRDGAEISNGLVDVTEYSDEGVADGGYRYTVKAEDHAGWLSDASVGVEVVLDTTPPITRIFAPQNNSTVSGVIQVKGTANGTNDFKEYRIYQRMGQNAEWELLKQSPVPIIADVLYELDTTDFSEDAAFSLKLEAEDINDNVGETVIHLSVDNQPPPPPTGLVAVVNGEDVSLTWNPNTETDLLGYLLFRGDQIVNAEVAIGDLTPYALSVTNYRDLALPDGKHAYTVAAIDRAGNVSEPSLVSEVVIDTRPPAAIIVKPADGARFGTTQYILATSESTDIAKVQFQYKATADSAWTDLDLADVSEPYSASFDPLELNLSQGMYQLRAIATDKGGVVDPAPAAITIHYTDVTRPAAVRGVVALANGPDVTLSWESATESDLAGYYIERIDLAGKVTRLTTEPLIETTFIDPVGIDGIYDYRVFSQDVNNNFSDPSDIVRVRVHTPLLQQPFTPLSVPKLAELVGRGVPLSIVTATVSNSDGVRNLPEVIVDSDGVFRLPNIGLMLGDNRFDIRLTDTSGNISKTASVTVTHGLPPAAPAGLAAEVAGYDVMLFWDDNTETDLFGYRVFRDGEDLLGEHRVAIASAAASVDADSAGRAIDSSLSSYWSVASTSQPPSEPTLFTLTLDQPELLTRLELEWRYSFYRMRNYDIQARSGDTWITLLRVRDAPSIKVHTYEFNAPYYSDQIRLRRLSTDTSTVQLADVRLYARKVLPAPSYIDTAIDGEFQYQVSAVSTLGFEGSRSEPLQVGVGDVTAPDAIQLSAEVNDATVYLSWLPSASGDVSRYELFRDGALLAELGVNDLSYLDENLVNGRYTYVVYVIDLSGLRSVASNQVEVDFTADPFEAPEFVSVTAIDDGSLDLLWRPLAGESSHYYRVLRAISTGGPYTAIADIESTQWRDRVLDSGITYYYQIVALDSAGNEGQRSRELSGTPLDQIAPDTVMLSPGANGIPYLSEDGVVDIFGQSEAGARIELLHDGIPAAEGAAASYTEITAYPVDPSSLNGSLSPDGRHLIQVLNRRIVVTNLQDGTSVQHSAIVNGSRFTWAGDGSGYAYSSRYYVSSIRRYTDIAYYKGVTWTGSSRLSYNFDRFNYPTLSTDRNLFAAIGQPRDGVFGLWSESNDTSDWRLLKEGYSVQGDSLRWSPDDRYLAYRVSDNSGVYQVLELFDFETGNSIVVDEQVDSQGNFSWSANSRSLLFSRNGTDGHHIWRYDVDTGLTEALTRGAGANFTDPYEFIGQSTLLAVSGGTDLVLIDIDRQVVDTVHQSGAIKPGSLHRARTGYFAFIDQQNAELIIVTPPGHFRFQEIPLRIGDNRFTAIASDDADYSVPSRNALEITYDLSYKPDLLVDTAAITVIPAVPQVGAEATVQVEISNIGGTRISDAVLTLVATDANGANQLLLGNTPLEYLAPGSSTVVAANWTPASDGTYGLQVIADPLDLIDESSEVNNSAEKSVLVVANADPLLNLSTDKPFYVPNEDVAVNLQLFNGGNAFSGYLEVVVEDALGFNVDRIVAQQSVDLAYGARENRQFIWNSGKIFAGEYRIHAYLYSHEHALVARQMAPFNISEVRGFSSEVYSDVDSYTGNRDVLVTATVNYASGNTVFTGAQGQLQIVDANAVVVAREDFDLGVMMPGDSRVVNLRWNTALSVPDSYTILFDVIRDQQRVTAATSEFNVIAGSDALQGVLSLVDDAPALGDTVSARFALTNRNNAAVEQLPVRIRLIDPASQRVLQEQTENVDIGTGATVNSSAEFATTTLNLVAHSVLLEAYVGGEPDGAWIKLAGADFSPRDRNPPIVEIRQPQGNGYLSGNADIVVLANDNLSFISTTEIQIDGEAWQPMALANATLGEYKFALTNLAEGHHTVRARATDAWNNLGQSHLVGFVVDNTPPIIQVVGVSDGGVYNLAVTPIVTIVEDYAGESYITNNGLPFVSGETLTDDGSYQLEVYAADLAGNESQLTVRVVIDQVAPIIGVSGVTDGAVYDASVTPVIQISDANLQNQHILLNGQPYNSGTPVDAEGEHLLDIAATDTAGNTSRVELRFRIDLSPPVITVSGILDGAHYNTDVAAIITVSDSGPYEVSSTLNGQPYSSGESIGAPGSYTLVVTANDVSGRSSDKRVTFVIDKTPPTIDITGVAENGFYPVAAPQINIDEDHLDTVSITLNGVDYVSQTPIYDEGAYLLRVVATDSAGNQGDREIAFTVDATPPSIIVDTPLHGETLSIRNTDVIGRTEPFANVELLIGEAQFSTQSNADGRFTFNGIILKQGSNTLLLNAVDQAGNRSPVTELLVEVISSSDLSGGYRAPSGVLIWSPLEQKYCDMKKPRETEKSSKYDKQDCHSHALSEMHQHQGEPAMTVIKKALDTAGRDYLLVHNQDDFLDALRSQRFGLLLLLDWHKYSCYKGDDPCDREGYKHAKLKVAKDHLLELRAMVASGSGLMMVKTHPDKRKYWEKLMGVRVDGELKDIAMIELLDNSITDHQRFNYTGRAIKLKPEGAETIALSLPRNESVITVNDYADGRSLMVGYNPGAVSDKSRMALLLGELFTHIAPSTSVLVGNGVAEIVWSVGAIAVDTPIELQVSLPPEMRFIHATGGVLDNDGRTATWQRHHIVGDDKFVALVRLPEVSGSYTLEAMLLNIENGQSELLNAGSLSLEVNDQFAELREQLIGSVAAIEGLGKGKSKKSDKLMETLNKVFEHDPAVAEVKYLEKSIDQLIKFIYEIDKEIADSDIIIKQSGEVLRYYQLAWYRQMSHDGVVDQP